MRMVEILKEAALDWSRHRSPRLGAVRCQEETMSGRRHDKRGRCPGKYAVHEAVVAVGTTHSTAGKQPASLRARSGQYSKDCCSVAF